MQGRLKGQPEQWKEQTEQWKEQIEQWKGFWFPLNGKPKDLQLKDCCHELCRKPLARNDRFCFQNSKIGYGTLVSYPRKTFVKRSEVD
jgi:hypothetical protein